MNWTGEDALQEHWFAAECDGLWWRQTLVATASEQYGSGRSMLSGTCKSDRLVRAIVPIARHRENVDANARSGR